MTEINESEDERPEDEEEDGDGDGGDDHASLSLETPESAAAIAAAMTQNLKGKKSTKGKPGAKGKALDVGLSDKALGLDGGEESSPKEDEAVEEEFSAFDRDEITDPSAEDHIDPLAVVLGAQERPWENDTLSAKEKRILAEHGYQRHDPTALEEGVAEDDPKASSKTASKTATRSALAAGAAAIAAVAVESRAAAPAQKSPTRMGTQQAAQGNASRDGTVLAGVSKGPERAADQAPEQQAQKKNVQNQQTQQTRQDQSKSPVLRRQDLAAEPKKDLVKDSLDILILTQIATNAEYPGHAAADPDWTLRQNMDLMAMALSMNGPAPGPEREAGWDQKRALGRENAQDIGGQTPAPEPREPAPQVDIRRDMQINIGPDMG